MSHGAKLKSGGRGNGGRGSNRPQFENKPRTGVFILLKSATATITNNFLNGIKDWGNSGELKHGVGELARPHQPGAIRVPNVPVRPDHDDMRDGGFVYDHREEVGHGDQLSERGLRIYKEDFDLYKHEKAVYDQTMREIAAEKCKLHGKLEACLSLDAKTELEKIYTSDIWTNKDPEALIEAIKSVFVGQLAGGGDNKVSRKMLKRELNTIARAPGETQLHFSRRFKDLVESYRHAELQGGDLDEEDLDVQLSDSNLADQYVMSCGLTNWLWSLQFETEKEQWPDSLAAAIKRANEFEEGMLKKGQNPYAAVNRSGAPTKEYDLYQAFLAQHEKNHFQNAKGKGKTKGNGINQQSQPKDQTKVDKGPCHSFHKTGTCAWTASHPDGPDCMYTHDKINKGSNQNPSVGAMTSAAVAQVNQQRAVGFAGGGGAASTGSGKLPAGNV